eukprot:jgi/Mesen1/6580/ME000336S05806
MQGSVQPHHRGDNCRQRRLGSNAWQAYWEEHQTFRAPEVVDTSKPKFYVLDMFPFPRRSAHPHHVAAAATVTLLRAQAPNPELKPKP